MSEPKPEMACPFCGSDAYVVFSPERNPVWRVRCSDRELCRASGPVASCAETAVKMWDGSRSIIASLRSRRDRW